MSIDLWISVALAIPLAIAANIFTPRVQKWLDTKLSEGKERKAAEQSQKRKAQLALLEKELAEAEALQSDKSNLTHHYLDALLKVAFYGAFGSIYASLFSFIGEIGRWDGLLGMVGRLGAQVTALFVAMIIFLTCFKAAKAARRAKVFPKYKQEMDRLIAELRTDST